MRPFTEFVVDTLESGGLAAVATTAAAVAAAKAEGQSAAAPLNAVSHIAWGDQAATEDNVSFKHTATGLALNTGAVVSWAAIYEAIFGSYAREGNRMASVAGGAAIAALAYVVDYHVVPRRFTPGFELRLSNGSLFGIYAALALSLGLAGMFRARQEG